MCKERAIGGKCLMEPSIACLAKDNLVVLVAVPSSTDQAAICGLLPEAKLHNVPHLQVR